MSHKVAYDMKMWKGKGNTITLLFCLRGLEILHQERRGQVNTIVMERFNNILFHKSEPANKQHSLSINQSFRLWRDREKISLQVVQFILVRVQWVIMGIYYCPWKSYFLLLRQNKTRLAPILHSYSYVHMYLLYDL